MLVVIVTVVLVGAAVDVGGGWSLSCDGVACLHCFIAVVLYPYTAVPSSFGLWKTEDTAFQPLKPIRRDLSSHFMVTTPLDEDGSIGHLVGIVFVVERYHTHTHTPL